jgi:serine/threonine protein kinase
MEERYEIKGKIGQGGLGAVYRAQDVRMNREVAIKRILTNVDDSTISEEATRQLVQEAGALASLQHPNIVTIYDVGSDDDGPFVVMELLTGETIEDLIAKGSFTWPDFRQLAMQSLEALIAAQELHLVHRDLKPGNIMLTWLPSGKFQVKIVDFGLAKLSAKPSLQTIDQSDGVFGSIYFMAPEQFERVPIDLKADLYAIGCVFYYALTGTYPFDGDNAAEVMAAHLQHHVTPLQEVREGIPVWACDWVMWHINRQPSDRPASAREALKLFLENDEQPSPTLSTGKPAAAPEAPKRPRLVIPGAAPVPDLVKEPTPTQPMKTASVPKALAPPVGSKPSVHTTAQVVHSSPPEPSEPPAPAPPQAPAEEPPLPTLEIAKPIPTPAPATAILKRAAAPASPISTVSLSKPKLAPTAQLTPPATPTATTPTSKTPAPPSIALPKAGKKGLSNGVKIGIALLLGVLAVILAIVFLKKSGQAATDKLYNEMMQQAAAEGATEVSVDERRLGILLSSAAHVGANENRDGIYMALYLAKSTDGTDVDARIAEFVTTREMIPNVRNVLIRDVLRKRNNPAIIGTLLNYARSTDDVAAAEAAIQACRFMANDSHFPEFLDIIRTTKESRLLKEAEENAATIIGKSSAKPALSASLFSAYDSAPNDEVRHAILRLIGRIGGEKALELTRTNLNSDEMKDKVAAIVTLGTWGDKAGYAELIAFLKSGPDLQLRGRAYDSALQHATAAESDVQEVWTLLAAESKTQDEQLKLIRGLANVTPDPWAYTILQNIADTSDSDQAVDLAERAIIRLQDIERTQGTDDEE